MNRLRAFFSLPAIPFFLLLFCLQACKVGEDDPFLSLRSRDARLKASWKLGSMHNIYEIRQVVPGGSTQVTVIDAQFNGYDLFVRTALNGILLSDTTFGFNHRLLIKDKGVLNYESTVIQSLAGIKSIGEDNWYWLDTDKKKARVYVGAGLQFPALAGISQLPSGFTLPTGALFTDFTVDALRNEELELSYNKTLEQVTITGFQQLKVSSKMQFNAR